MGPTMGSSSLATSKPSSSSSRAVKIPHRSTQDDQTSSQVPSYRRRGKQGKTFAPPDAANHHLSSSTESSSSYSTSPVPASSSSHHHHHHHQQNAGTPSSSYSSADSSSSLYPPSPHTGKLKAKAPSTTASTTFPSPPSSLGPTMHPSSSHSYRSINLNDTHDPSMPQNLLTYTRSGQGFTWNEELFLPSYMMGRYSHSGERRRRRRYDDDLGDDDVVDIAEIHVSDEEARQMMP